MAHWNQICYHPANKEGGRVTSCWWDTSSGFKQDLRVFLRTCRKSGCNAIRQTEVPELTSDGCVGWIFVFMWDQATICINGVSQRWLLRKNPYLIQCLTYDNHLFFLYYTEATLNQSPESICHFNFFLLKYYSRNWNNQAFRNKNFLIIFKDKWMIILHTP